MGGRCDRRIGDHDHDPLTPRIPFVLGTCVKRERANLSSSILTPLCGFIRGGVIFISDDNRKNERYDHLL